MRFLNCPRFYFSAGLIHILLHAYRVTIRVMVSARLRMELGVSETARITVGWWMQIARDMAVAVTLQTRAVFLTVIGLTYLFVDESGYVDMQSPLFA